MKRGFFGLTILVLVFALWPYQPTLAQTSPEVIINEIMWMGNDSDFQDEWLELKNISCQEINLYGWKITGVRRSGVELLIPTKTKIAPGGFFLISAKSIADSILAIDPDLMLDSNFFDFSLNNSELKIQLYDEKGNLVDTAGDGKEPLAGSNKKPKASMERKTEAIDGTKKESWQTAFSSVNLDFVAKEKATPKAENSIAVHTPGIIINEILPNPVVGEKEFIELYNNGSTAVNLECWYLDDIDNGGSSPYRISEQEIPAGGHVAFNNSLTKISLNDTGDSARLLWPDQVQVEKIDYSSSIKGQSYARKPDNSWAWTTTITRESENKFTQPVIPIILISEAIKKDEDTEVIVEGVITAPPKILGKQIFYIQDDSAGVQIYNYWGNFDNYSLGDKIRVQGLISHSEPKIKTSQTPVITNLGKTDLIKPAKINMAEAGSFLGKLVEIEGNVVETSGDTFYLSDGSIEKLKIYIKDTTGIDKPEMQKGDKVKIIGIVSVYDGQYRILPRYQADVEITGKKTKVIEESKPKLIITKDDLNDDEEEFSYRLPAGWQNSFSQVKGISTKNPPISSFDLLRLGIALALTFLLLLTVDLMVGRQINDF